MTKIEILLKMAEDLMGHVNDPDQLAPVVGGVKDGDGFIKEANDDIADAKVHFSLGEDGLAALAIAHVFLGVGSAIIANSRGFYRTRTT